MRILEEIAKLKRERNAIILAHNYCRPEVQDIADFTGDSLELSRKAAAVKEDVIVFCGVYFMAETAKILSPEKTVIIPDLSAGCPMADMVTGKALREYKAKHPKTKLVCYVNSTAEVKAECDICVTSGNAEAVMKSFAPNEPILFVPDKHLGSHIAGLLGRTYELWEGYCPIHNALTVEAIAQAKREHPGVKVMVHPECPADVRAAADYQLSTGGMCKLAGESSETEFIVGTECGILHRLRKENPGKLFYPVGNLLCEDMKKVTIEKVYEALKSMSPVVEVRAEISKSAKRAISAMLEVSGK